MTRFWLSINRIEALADGIFAISMTLLVLSINVPKVTGDDADVELMGILSDNWHQFEHYVLSFLLLAMFWLIHHRQFHFIKRVSESFLWLNILVLMLVALVPFSTSFMTDYNNLQIPNLVFQANLMAIGLVYLAMWRYATGNYRLIGRDEIKVSVIYGTTLLYLVTPALSLVAMGVTFVSPSYSEMVYIAAPFIISFMRKRLRK